MTKYDLVAIGIKDENLLLMKIENLNNNYIVQKRERD